MERPRGDYELWHKQIALPLLTKQVASTCLSNCSQRQFRTPRLDSSWYPAVNRFSHLLCAVGPLMAGSRSVHRVCETLTSLSSSLLQIAPAPHTDGARPLAGILARSFAVSPLATLESRVLDSGYSRMKSVQLKPSNATMLLIMNTPCRAFWYAATASAR